MQHVELTAIKQLLVEGRPITPESFNKRCETIYSALAANVEEVSEDESVPETESTGGEPTTEGVVE